MMNTYQVFKLPPSLFYDAVLATDYDTHPTQVAYLCSTDNQGVDIEATSGENSRHAGQHTRLILHKTVQSMSIENDQSTWVEMLYRW